jgi:hypothetical protein
MNNEQIGDRMNARTDLTVTLHFGLDESTIEFIQALEDELDEALMRLGFSRTTSTKSGSLVTFNYYLAMAALIHEEAAAGDGSEG